MRIWGKYLTAVLVLLFLSITPSTAEIKYVKIRSDNNPTILFDKFGFTNTGYVSVEISSVAISSLPVTSRMTQPNPSRIGFFLLSDDAQHDFNYENYVCGLDSKYITILFTFRDLSPLPQSSLTTSYNMTYPSVYSLYFANCNPLSCVTMDVLTEFYSTDGTTKNYLSVGLTQLPSIYFIFSLIYLCFLGHWITLCFNNQTSFHTIHILMGLLLVVKALNLFCALGVQHSVKITGTRSHGWDVLFYISQFITSTLWYTVIALNGVGWRFFNPILQISGRMVLLIVMVFQVWFNLVSKSRETRPLSEFWWTWIMVLTLSLIDYICGILITFLISSSIPLLREACEKDGKSAWNSANLTLLDKFSEVVFVYLFLVRAAILLLLHTVMFTQGGEYQWLAIVVQEIGTLVFNMVMLNMFRPGKENEYLSLEDEDEEMVVRDRELELDDEDEEEEFEL